LWNIRTGLVFVKGLAWPVESPILIVSVSRLISGVKVAFVSHCTIGGTKLASSESPFCYQPHPICILHSIVPHPTESSGLEFAQGKAPYASVKPASRRSLPRTIAAE
jgi:hypothetical protein